MMENVEFTTPSGHKLSIRTGLTFPEKRRLQRVIYSAARLDPQTGQRVVDLGAQIDVQDAVLKLLVRRVQFANGKVIEGSEEAIFNSLSEFADADVVATYDKIDELTKNLDIFPNPEREKKLDT
jgi:hypothetical protein